MNNVKKVLMIILFIYLICSFWFMYLFFIDNIRQKESETAEVLVFNKQVQKSNNRDTFQQKLVHIWGKAAIAEYFWLHIFEGELQQQPAVLLEEGQLEVGSLKLAYSTGPYLLPHTANHNVVNLVLIINGRESKKIEKSKLWLNELTNKEKFPKLENLGIIVLGKESCNNDWLLQYYNLNMIKFLFVVYDISLTHRIYQWPLGVATYRKFPLISKNQIDIHSTRKYKCNFLGTIYKNSSREILIKMLEQNRDVFNCLIKVRLSWKPKETKQTLNQYHNALQESDLTLCPVGVNSESYRIYEAMSYGSVPVLEDVVTNSQCSSGFNNVKAPYRLLKMYKAPVIFIKSWKELEYTMKEEKLLTDVEIVARRKHVLDWYELFRYKMRENFLDVLQNSFE